MFEDFIKAQDSGLKTGEKQAMFDDVPQEVGERALEILDKYDLNWSTEKQRYEVPEGYEYPDAFGMYALNCGKGGSQHKWLGSVGADYTPIQNSEMVELSILMFEQAGLTGEINAGHLGYSKVFLQSKLTNLKVGSDTLRRWITLLDYKSNGGFAIGTTNQVVVCENTFHAAFGDVGIRLKHTASVKDRIKEHAVNLVNAINSEKRLVEEFKKFHAFEINMNDEPTRELIEGLVKNSMNLDISLADDKAYHDSLERMSTRSQNKARSIMRALDKSVKQHGNTGWGLFNGITYMTNHVLPYDRNGKLKGDLFDYLSDGTGFNVNRKAYQFLKKELITDAEPVTV